MKNNQKYIINILELIPQEWNKEDIDNHFVKVSYTTIGRGNSPKPFVLPKQIYLDKNFVEAIAMYIGDGKLSKDMHHLDFCSIDKDRLI